MQHVLPTRDLLTELAQHATHPGDTFTSSVVAPDPTPNGAYTLYLATHDNTVTILEAHTTKPIYPHQLNRTGFVGDCQAGFCASTVVLVRAS